MKYFSPRYLMTFSLLSWLIIKTISPLYYTIRPSIKALLFLGSYLLAFYYGTWLISLLFKKRNVKIQSFSFKNNSYSKNILQRIYIIFLFLAIIGLSLRFYDLLFIKSYLAYSSSADFRINYNESNTNYGIVSIISACLFPFGFLLIMLVIYNKDQFSIGKKYIASLLFLAVILYIILLGGRTMITLILVMMCISIFSTGDYRKLTKKIIINIKNIKYLFIGILVVFAFVYYSMELLIQRLQLQGFSSVLSGLNYMQYQHHFVISNYLTTIAQENQFSAALVYTIVSLLHYFIHGYYQFFLEIDHFDINNVAYGAFQYYPIFKFFNVVGIDTFSRFTNQYLYSIVYESGVYETFYGPVYMDFGYFGFVYCFMLGALSQYSWCMFKKYSNFHLFLYPFIAAVIVHSSYLNMIQSGMGLYFVVSIILAGLIMKNFKFKMSIDIWT